MSPPVEVSDWFRNTARAIRDCTHGSVTVEKSDTRYWDQGRRCWRWRCSRCGLVMIRPEGEGAAFAEATETVSAQGNSSPP